MSRLADQVAELEEQLEDAVTRNRDLIQENSVQADTINTLTASINGATREIDELYEQLQYYEQLHPELRTTWKVKQRMEDT
jgi:phage shock protein A